MGGGGVFVFQSGNFSTQNDRRQFSNKAGIADDPFSPKCVTL